MRFTKKGITFRYHGDTMLWKWPFTRSGSGKYRSSLYPQDFSNLAEYWKYVGIVEAAILKNPEKISAFSWMEVLSTWVRRTYPGDHLVILTNLDASAKGVSFWARLPKDKVEDLLQDVVVLHCKDKPEVFRIVESIPTHFADAYGFSASELIDTNFGKEP